MEHLYKLKEKRQISDRKWGSDDDGNTIMHVAAATGRQDLLEYFFLDKIGRTDINAENYMGWTPLMQAARNGHLNCVKYLIRNADLFKRNKYGLCALTLACAHGDLEIVRIIFYHMLNSGGRIKQIQNPISPLTFSSLFGHLEIVQFLIFQSFDVDHYVVRTGITPYYCAEIVSNKQIMALLKENSNKSGTSTSSSFIPEINITKSSGKDVRCYSTALPRRSSNINSPLTPTEISPISPVFTEHNRSNQDLSLNQYDSLLRHSPAGDTLLKYSPAKNDRVFFPADFEIPIQNKTVSRIPPKNRSCSDLELIRTPNCNGYLVRENVDCQETVFHYSMHITRKLSEGNYIDGGKTVEKSISPSLINTLSTKNFQMVTNNNANLPLNSPGYSTRTLISPNNSESNKQFSNLLKRLQQFSKECFAKLLTILQINGLGSLIPIFVAEEIDFDIFLTLKENDLNKIGIKSKTDQQKILDIISKY